MAVRANEVVRDGAEPGHESVVWRQLEQTPVDLGEANQQLAELEVITGHGADLGDQLLANVFGDGLLIKLGGEVIAALGRIFVERPLEEIQGGGDLAEKLFLAELKN